MKMVKLSKILVVSISALSINAFADVSTPTGTDVQDVHVNTNATSNTGTSSDSAFADSAITTDVKSAFVKEKLFGTASVSAFSIGVETKNGVVQLTGTADSQTQADNAVKLAKQVAGVKSVESAIEIKMPAAN